jgi:cytochrome bd ubiquinol oxidase subunit II
MLLEDAVALVGLLAVMAYAVLAGADFGGGIWDLLARGPRAAEHRAAIARAMGPVWEANHVWLIFLIVLLFTAFPAAFSALSIALFIPFHLALLGIVLRGAAFVFRAHAATIDRTGAGWGHVFGGASIITPFLLGTALGAVSSGRIRVERGAVLSGYLAPWLAPFPLSVGALALAVCAYLAAVYLTLETRGATQDDFRRCALAAGGVMAALAAVTLWIAAEDAPRLWSELTHRRAAPVLAGGVFLALVSTGAIFIRRYPLGRVAAAGQVVLLLLGWGLAQYPYLIYPDVTLAESAAPPATLRFFLWTLLPGGLTLIPSLWFLFAVFKGENPAFGVEGPQRHEGREESDLIRR